VRGTDYGAVNWLHDPAIHEEDGVTYLLYAVGVEAGIAIARVDFERGDGDVASKIRQEHQKQ